MSKLMYSEIGGFHYFPDGELPVGWVDGEPIRQAILDAKRLKATIPATPQETVTPQDTPKRRPGRPPKQPIVEQVYGNSTNDN